MEFDSPVSVLAILGRAGIEEPCVLIAGMVHDQVHHKFHVALLQALDELVDILKSSIFRIDVLIVGDIIAHIGLWRFEDWAGPYHVHWQ